MHCCIELAAECADVALHAAADVEALLRAGAANRHTSSTLMNKRSSRSHTVLTCSMERTEVRRLPL